MYNEILKELEGKIKTSLEVKNIEVKKKRNSKLKFLSIKDFYSTNLYQIVNDIQLLLNSIAKEKEQSEHKDDESPASKITMLSLNWADEGLSTHFNEVRNKRQQVQNYWVARSEEILDGAFTCKILVENISETSRNNQFYHGAGIIQHDKNVSERGYYAYACCLFLSNGDISKPFEGNPNPNIKTLKPWKNGDIIIIKRDTDNDLWFGLNDESDMVKSANVPGSFRIVMGFIKADKENEVFKMIYLQ